jgi:hypothetical protein
MTIEHKLDKILDVLYDDKELLWKQISTTDIVIFGKRKYGIDWEDADISFIMTMLINDDYVVMNKGEFSDDNIKMPTYSLTTRNKMINVIAFIRVLGTIKVCVLITYLASSPTTQGKV